MARELSKEQQAVVASDPNCHAIVLAVAGSGKSTCLVERIAYLHEVHRVPSKEMLAVMFNKDAAIQLKESLDARMGAANSPLALTFHGLGSATLKLLHHHGLLEHWTFEAAPRTNTWFAASVLKKYTDKYKIKNVFAVSELFVGFVDRIKSDMLDAKTIFLRDEYSADLSWFVTAYKEYEEARISEKKRFFSDLIYDALIAVNTIPAAAELVADRYQHIVVDEYQDICESQQRLVDAVAGKRARVMVVGDDDQTIYTWRGAKPSYILKDFAERYKNPIIHRLSRTWRYGHTLSLVANSVITKNTVRADKLCISGKTIGHTHVILKRVPAYEDLDVLPYVKEWLQVKGAQLQDIAILLRTYSRSGAIQLQLLREGFPFRMVGPDDVGVFGHAWIKNLLSWLKLAAGEFGRHAYQGEPDSKSIAMAFEIVMPVWTGLERSVARQLAIDLLKEPRANITVASFINDNPSWSESLKGRLRNIARLWDFIRGLNMPHSLNRSRQVTSEMVAVNYNSASSILRFMYNELDMEEVIRATISDKIKAEDHIELLQAFLRYTEMYDDSVDLYLQHVNALISFSEQARNRLDAITMTSVHRSKGLEWPCVIMPALRQGWFPYKRGTKVGEVVCLDENEIEDERRLFYVAVTRTRRRLYLLAPADHKLEDSIVLGNSTAPTSRLKAGESASQFVYEMNYNMAIVVGNQLSGAKQGDLSAIAKMEDKALALNYIKAQIQD